MRNEDIRIGSFCTGYGGLDMAVMAVLSGRLAWVADNDKHVSTILAARYPNVPNLGDLTALGWRSVPPVDILCAGFPCQDISSAGTKAGIEKGEKSGIWKNIVEGICILRPKLIIVENVSAIRSRGLDRVLGDLAEAGYDAIWTSLSASDVGAPHKRERVFILGYTKEPREILLTADTLRQRSLRQPTCTPARYAGTSAPALGRSGLSCPRAADHKSRGQIAWGRYEPAIRRWEALTGRAAPYPIEPGTHGQPRLSPAFSEWMMGLPRGFVTDLPLPYSAQHRAIGNGVVPHQAVRALWELVEMAVTTAHPEEQMAA
jgi:DNA (cytosine-5)-methyltransferase 1